MKGLALALIAAAVTLSACGSEATEQTAQEAVRTSPQRTISEEPKASSDSDHLTTTSTTAAPPPCSAPTFLPVLGHGLDDRAKKLHIVRAEVRRCRNGYAQVFAVPDASVCQPAVGYCYETEQVFLGWTKGSWRILFAGTGITCEEPGFETIPRIRRACGALGYPGYES